ncbi:unnamed protein product [Dimorphilus gyrociliatus]|uniref:RING-type domain-containing protein n=1 Tax=Dimorphilus gyrociliatus TaxID=2664684 RepID=A0A7I8W9P4_9ANNE|nr:unnamed protein product [Dimorphilus gyrociliatus]
MDETYRNCCLCGNEVTKTTVRILSCLHTLCKDCLFLLRTSSCYNECSCPLCGFITICDQDSNDQEEEIALPPTNNSEQLDLNREETSFDCFEQSNELDRKALHELDDKKVDSSKIEIRNITKKLENIREKLKQYYTLRSSKDKDIHSYLEFMISEDYYTFLNFLDDKKDSEISMLECLKHDNKENKLPFLSMNNEFIQNFLQKFSISSELKARKVINRLNHNYNSFGQKSMNKVIQSIRGRDGRMHTILENCLRSLTMKRDVLLNESVEETVFVKVTGAENILGILPNFGPSSSLIVSSKELNQTYAIRSINTNGDALILGTSKDPFNTVFSLDKDICYIQMGYFWYLNLSKRRTVKLLDGIVDAACDKLNILHCLTKDAYIEYYDENLSVETLSHKSNPKESFNFKAFCLLRSSCFIAIDENCSESSWLWIYDGLNSESSFQPFEESKDLKFQPKILDRPSSICSIDENTIIIGYTNLKKLEIFKVDEREKQQVIDIEFHSNIIKYNPSTKQLYITEKNSNKIHSIKL